MLPAELWGMIVPYINDPLSCHELNLALPDHIRARIKPMLEKHIVDISIKMAYELNPNI